MRSLLMLFPLALCVSANPTPVVLWHGMGDFLNDENL